MDSGRGQSPERDASLRRVAIVLHSLPESVAIRLLGDIPPEKRRRLRDTMRALGDVEPWERQLALQSFRGSIRGSTEPTHSGPDNSPRPDNSSRHRSEQSGSSLGDDEATFSHAADAHATTEHRTDGNRTDRADGNRTDRTDGNRRESADNAGSSLAFLRDVPDASMAELLGGEHPQTIALVLATIDPDQAARVLPKLHPVQRQEAISRIGRLSEIPADAVSEIAEHLRSRVTNGPDQRPGSGDNGKPATEGQRALTAIFAKLPRPLDNGHAPADAARHPRPEPSDDSASAQISRLRELRDQLDATSSQPTSSQPSSPQRNSSQSAPPQTSSDANRTGRSGNDDLAQNVHPGDLPSDRRVAPPTDARANRADSRASNPAPDHSQPSTRQRPTAADQPHLSTDQIHRHLVGLAPEELCRALGKVDTRQALLTLCGLPPDIAEAVLAVLPRGHGKTVRRQLAALGSLRIRDIDEAKQAVAHAAQTIAAENGSTPTAATGRDRNGPGNPNGPAASNERSSNDPRPLQPVAA